MRSNIPQPFKRDSYRRVNQGVQEELQRKRDRENRLLHIAFSYPPLDDWFQKEVDIRTLVLTHGIFTGD